MAAGGVDNESSAEEEAYTITTLFFKDMVGTALVRVADVVAEAEDYNLSIRATLLSDDEDVPGVLRRVFSNIAALKFGGGGMSTIQSLYWDSSSSISCTIPNSELGYHIPSSAGQLEPHKPPLPHLSNSLIASSTPIL